MIIKPTSNSTNVREKKLLFFVWLSPLIIIQTFLSVSVLLIWVGPWPWPLTHPFRLLCYLVLGQVSIAVGYIYGRPIIDPKFSELLKFQAIKARGVRFAKWCILLSALMIIPTSYVRTGNLFPPVLSAISQSGYTYNQAFDLASAINGKFYVEYVRICISIFLISALPLSILYWRFFSLFWRIIAGINTFGIVGIYIGAGQNKGLADFIAITPFLLLAGWYRYGRGLKGYFLSRLTLAAAMMLLIVVFISFFSTGQQQREGGVGLNGVFFDGRTYIYADSGVIGERLSDDNRIAYESFTRYVTAGYYALDLSFNLDSKFTFGFGNSMFIARNADALGGFDYFTSKSIPGRLESEFGYSQFRLWHSIYPWFASDVGYIGALILIGIFGYLLSKYWSLTLITGDHTCAALSYILLMLFYYVPCNNQIFQSGEFCVGFVLLLATAFSKNSHLTVV